MDYSISNLQETLIHQQKQIEQNQELLFKREQHLKYLNQQQTIHEQQERKHFHLKTLQNQINQQKTSNSTIGLFTHVIKIAAKSASISRFPGRLIVRSIAIDRDFDKNR